MNIQKNIFLATHPVLNNLTRAMSVFGSVNRAVMSALNTINIAMIALNTNSSGVAQANADLLQAQREYNDAVRKFGPDSREAIEAMDKLRVAEVKLAEETQNRTNQITSAWIAVVSGISGVVTCIVLTLPKILPVLSRVGAGFSSFFGLIGAGTAGVGIGALVFPSIDEWLKGQAKWYAEWANFRDNVMGPAINGFFVETIPSFLVTGGKLWLEGWTKMLNGAISLINFFGATWVSGVNALVLSIIGFINNIIKKINSIGRGIVKIKLLTEQEPLKFTPIGGIGGAGGGANFPGGISSQTNPGEFITPRVSGGGGGSTIVQNITVQGSIVTENEMKASFDKWLKDALKAVGFG